MQESLIVSIDGRDALPVRAIPYVAGRSFYSPDEVAKHLARAIDAPFARLKNTTAFRLSGQSPKPVLPKDWHATVAYIDALESKLKRKQHTHAEGYAKWLKQATQLLPASVFVWREDFEKDFHHDIQGRLPEFMAEGDDVLNYSPMLSEHERKMILEGALLYGRMHGKVCNMEEPNWREWRHTPNVMLWQACALSMNLDPYSMTRWQTESLSEYEHVLNKKALFFLDLRNFASRDDKEEFKLRLRLLVKNRDDRTHFPQRRPDLFEPSPDDYSEVALSELSHWASSVVKWDNLPAELLAVAQKPEKQADAPAQPNDAKHELPAGDSASDTDKTLAALFDPVPVGALEKMFPAGGKWKNWSERAKDNELDTARVKRGRFNPYRAAMWFLGRGLPDWDMARCNRTLAANLPARSKDHKHLLTGDLD